MSLVASRMLYVGYNYDMPFYIESQVALLSAEIIIIMDIQTISIYSNCLLIWTEIIKMRILKRRRRIVRRWWVKPHLYTNVRHNLGAHQNLFMYFQTNDHEEFFKFTRMSVQQFNYLHDLLKPILKKRSRREPLPTEVRVAATLSFLAHGDSAATTSLFFRIGKSTLYNIIPEVCNAIWKILQPIYLRCPQEENEWIRIAEEFNTIWNFPNCIGAIDGKHCRIQAPPNSGSAFHNYKSYFSLILMAIADARYRFIWVDIGDYGSLNDAGIWSNTAMNEAFENDTLFIPKARPLPNTNCLLPFCLVGDEGFPLKRYLMRPFAKRNLRNNDQRIFNYRLSRARRIVENTFGILVSRWRILEKPLALKLSTIEKIIQAVTCLHNYIITTNTANNQYLYEGMVDHEDANGEIIPGNWRNLVRENGNFINPLGRIGANIGTAAAIRQRETLTQYFVSEEGSISWQWEQIQ